MNKKDIPCSHCSLRQKYDKKPKSLLGRFWHWHIGFCPGWKAYFQSLTKEEQNLLSEKYNIGKKDKQ